MVFINMVLYVRTHPSSKILLIFGDESFTNLYSYKRYRGSYMSAHVLLNLVNELEKRDKMRGLLSILSFFRNEFNKFNET